MYFTKFPKMLYDLKSDGNVKVVTDIFRRIKVRDKIGNNISLFDKFHGILGFKIFPYHPEIGVQ